MSVELTEKDAIFKEGIESNITLTFHAKQHFLAIKEIPRR